MCSARRTQRPCHQLACSVRVAHQQLTAHALRCICQRGTWSHVPCCETGLNIVPHPQTCTIVAAVALARVKTASCSHNACAAGLLAALSCVRGHRVHLFGFNWCADCLTQCVPDTLCMHCPALRSRCMHLPVYLG